MVSTKKLCRFLFSFIHQQKWAFLVVFVLDALTWPLDVLIWPYLLKVVIDIFTTFEANRMAALGALQYPIYGGLALVLGVEIASRTEGLIFAKALPKLQARIRMHMFDHIQHHSPNYFNEKFAGSLANKITDMTTQVDVILEQLFFPIVPALSAALLGALFLWFVNPLFSGILLVWMAIHVVICLKFASKCDVYEQKHGAARSLLLGKIVDSFTNNFAVNLFYRFRYEKKLLEPFQQEEETTSVKAKQIVEKMRVITSAFFILGVIFGILGLLIYLWLHGKISTGQAVQVFTTTWSLGGIMWVVGSAFPLLFRAIGVAKQAAGLMEDPQDIVDCPNASPLVIANGEIIFDSVTFHYGKKTLFVNKHAHIQGGEKVGLVGFTGAGKSTFTNLILRFFPLKEGRILIDNQDIAKVTLSSLRSQIALIPQDPLLFHRSLKENIAYGNPEASDAEIFEAAKLAHCFEFISKLPQGFESKVGERGTKLSGGEKQRIAIARALLTKAPLLILDEATSALDSVTEKYIQESLEKLMKNKTTLVIAHRLSTLSQMDRILVFHEGKIVEEGKHQDLLAINGFYAKMWTMQAGGFLPDTPHIVSLNSKRDTLYH